MKDEEHGAKNEFRSEFKRTIGELERYNEEIMPNINEGRDL